MVAVTLVKNERLELRAWVRFEGRGMVIGRTLDGSRYVVALPGDVLVDLPREILTVDEP